MDRLSLGQCSYSWTHFIADIWHTNPITVSGILWVALYMKYQVAATVIGVLKTSMSSRCNCCHGIFPMWKLFVVIKCTSCDQRRCFVLAHICECVCGRVRACVRVRVCVCVCASFLTNRCLTLACFKWWTAVWWMNYTSMYKMNRWYKWTDKHYRSGLDSI